MIEALCWSSQPNSFWPKRQRTVSMLPNFFELKTMLQLPSPPFTKLDECSKRYLAPNPLNVTFTIAGTVTVKNTEITDHKEMMMALMHQHFDTRERGIVLQLVSTEIDPSKPYILSAFFIYFFIRKKQWPRYFNFYTKYLSEPLIF